jgi:hypothetical protein
MAQKAKKDLAKANTAALNNLHTLSAFFNIAFLLFHFLFRSRSLLLFLFLSTPALISEVILERTGRPKYDANTNALRTAGEDLAAPGLTEYMFDLVWVTWACLVLVVLFGNWGWLLWAAVPAYGLYQGFNLLGVGRRMAQMQGASGDGAGAGAAQGNRKQRRAAA